MNVGEKIRAERERRKWTARDLAYRTGFTEVWISQVETGKKPASEKFLIAVANGFGVTVAELLEGTEEAKG